MVLITLEPRPMDCRVELDGVDITRRVLRVELDADAGCLTTVVRLTLRDSAVIAGKAGRLEFVDAPPRQA